MSVSTLLSSIGNGKAYRLRLNFFISVGKY